jgi:hypothetical protein
VLLVRMPLVLTPLVPVKGQPVVPLEQEQFPVVE